MTGEHPDWEIGAVEYEPGVVPLSEATIWPDDKPESMTLPSGRVVWAIPPGAHEAARIEQMGNRRLGLMPCGGDHREELPCRNCGAAI